MNTGKATGETAEKRRESLFRASSSPSMPQMRVFGSGTDGVFSSSLYSSFSFLINGWNVRLEGSLLLYCFPYHKPLYGLTFNIKQAMAVNIYILVIIVAVITVIIGSMISPGGNIGGRLSLIGQVTTTFCAGNPPPVDGSIPPPSLPDCTCDNCDRHTTPTCFPIEKTPTCSYASPSPSQVCTAANGKKGFVCLCTYNCV